MSTCPCCGQPITAPPGPIVDLSSNTFFSATAKIELSPKMAEFLSILCAARPRYVKIEALHDAIYGLHDADAPCIEVIRVWASKIRKTLIGSGWQIDSSLGRRGGPRGKCGYRLVPESEAWWDRSRFLGRDRFLREWQARRASESEPKIFA